MLTFETEAIKNGYNLIAGIDEAGRGPLAGPVVASAVILPNTYVDSNIKDSKKISEKKRKILFAQIINNAISIGIGIVCNNIIDKINILNATKLAMKTAVSNLNVNPDIVLIDGRDTINIENDQKAIIKGDTLSQTIAAASIIAKVTRDRIMYIHHFDYPKYKFSSHKGYGTKAHYEAIEKHGITTIHRKTFIH